MIQFDYDRMKQKGRTAMRQIERTEQRQSMNQRQRHSLKVLAMSGTELDTYLEDCYDNNPFICKEENRKEDWRNTEGGVETCLEQAAVTEGEVHADLILQAHTMGLSRTEEKIGDYLIGSLDDRGFLPEDCGAAAETLGLEPDCIESVLRRFQTNMEPAGVFARSLAECLLIQLARDPCPDTLAMEIVRNHLEQLAAQDRETILLSTGAEPEELERAIGAIRSLSPYPLNGTPDVRPVRYKTPELEVIREGDRLEIRLLERNSTYSLERVYREACRAGTVSAEERRQMQGRMNEARELMDAVRQRDRTILRVAGFLMEHQKNYFLTGAPLSGLTETDAAAALRISVSTVSRTVREKYYLFQNEVFDLSDLFATRLSCGFSRQEVQWLIQSLITSENALSPVSDFEIAQYCSSNGYHIARRTIAKYREMLKIPPASRRGAVEQNPAGRTVGQMAARQVE